MYRNFQKSTLLLLCALCICILCTCNIHNLTALHISIEDSNNFKRRCLDVSNYVVIARVGDTLFNNMFEVLGMNNDSSVNIRFAENLQFKGDSTDINIVSIGTNHTILYEKDKVNRRIYKLKILKDIVKYDIDLSGKLPLIKDVTQIENPFDTVINQESIEECSLIKTVWSEVYNKHYCRVKHGLEKKFTHDGQLISQVNYENGTAMGLTQNWYEDGTPSVKGYFYQNNRDSVWTFWHDNGNEKGIAIYNRGVPTGEWKSWHRVGTLEEVGIYENGQKEGIWKTYYPNGNLKGQGSYHNSMKTGLWENWHANGQPLSTGDIQDNNLTGIWRYWYDNGQKESEGEYTANLKHGLWTSWHSNGIKKSEGLYNYGKKVGEWKYWSESGALESFTEIRNDSVISKYADGTPKKIERFKDGRKTGTWTEWYSNGQLKHVVDHNNNFRKYNETEWYESGQIKHEIKYINNIGRAVKVETEWYENGRIKYLDDEHAGTEDTIKTWHENGILESVYLSYNRNAPLNTYYENGNIRSERIFRSGLKDSLAAEWYINGQKKNERRFIDEDSLYLIRAWYPNGQLSLQGKERYLSRYEQIQCEDRVPQVGIWRYWDEAGNLLREVNFFDDSSGTD